MWHHRAESLSLDELLDTNKCKDLNSIVDTIKSSHTRNVVNSTDTSAYLPSKEFLNELRRPRTDVDVVFGATFRDIQFKSLDECGREHTCFVTYTARDKLKITATDLPYGDYQKSEYRSLEDVINVFQSYVQRLCKYFQELERIDRFCCVVEPVAPTFKDDYRKILLDERVWLHVEVTLDGSPTNVHLVGSSGSWYDKLQKGLPNWDHDESIVDNIIFIFDIDEFPRITNLELSQLQQSAPHGVYKCGICLCTELPDPTVGLPQPLCSNPKCGVYYHKDCLFQWLVASAGGRPPNFGIATGQCPNCLKLVSCSK